MLDMCYMFICLCEITVENGEWNGMGGRVNAWNELNEWVPNVKNAHIHVITSSGTICLYPPFQALSQ